MLLKPADVLYGSHTGPGAFYAVIPWGVLVLFAGVTFVFSIVALVMGGMNFWRDTASGTVGDGRTIGAALRDVLTLRYLGARGMAATISASRFTQTPALLASLHVLRILLCFARLASRRSTPTFSAMTRPIRSSACRCCSGRLAGCCSLSARPA